MLNGALFLEEVPFQCSKETGKQSSSFSLVDSSPGTV